MQSSLLPLSVVHCRGSALELGYAQGEAYRAKIVIFVEQRLAALTQYLTERGSSDLSRFFDLGARCFAQAERWDPEAMLEHRGIARAAGVDAARLYAVTNMTDLRDALLWTHGDPEGCSAFQLPKALTREGVVVAGQTWDLNPMDLDYVIAVHRQPSEGVETWAVTCVGCLSLIGMNAEGLSVGTTNIKSRRTQVGVGYLSLLHRALRCRTRAEADREITSARRAAAHTYWLADAEGAVELECDAERVARRELDGAPITRTNHCLAEDLRVSEGEEPSPSSFARIDRLQTLLGRGNHDVASLKSVFADRSAGVLSINRYPEDEQGTTTNACTLMIPARREFWACRGPSDRGEWQQLSFAGA